MKDKLRVRDVESFVKDFLNTYEKKYLDYNIMIIISLTHLFFFSIFFAIKDYIFVIPGLLITLGLAGFTSIIIIKTNHLWNNKKRNEALEEFLNELRVHTYTTGDYKCLNFFLLDKKFPDFVIQFFYVFSHAGGKWLDREQMMIKSEYGDKDHFLDKSFEFIDKYKNVLDFEKVSHYEIISDYLAFVFPDRIKKLVKGLEEL